MVILWLNGFEELADTVPKQYSRLLSAAAKTLFILRRSAYAAQVSPSFSGGLKQFVAEKQAARNDALISSDIHFQSDAENAPCSGANQKYPHRICAPHLRSD